MDTPLFSLHDYQTDAANAAIRWMRRSVEPACVMLPTGAGKSYVLAAIAKWVDETVHKNVLCIAPSKELIEQDYEKYLKTGNPASIFSASCGVKSTEHAVVFGTPGTVVNAPDAFGEAFGAVVIDEAQGITPTIKTIIARLREINPKLRVVGLTATPYRMHTGYIYRYGTSGKYVGDDATHDPYYNTLVYEIGADELIARGYLSPVVVGVAAARYDAGGLKLNNRGSFNSDDIERVFDRQSVTPAILRDVVARTADRKGVILYAATVRHAKEILRQMPKNQTRMIGGTVNMRKAEREVLLADFRAQRFKYLVNVQVLTVGFDAPHVDAIAVLRATESPGLFQQIIGRGLRLSPSTGKQDCLLLDYAQNIERHGLGDNLFKPVIVVKGGEAASEPIEVTCPDCGYANQFVARPNPNELPSDDYGYFLGADGKRIESKFGPIPSHYGRRCAGQVKGETPGTFVRCGHRWSSKKCPKCGTENDLAARECQSCHEELTRPDHNLSATLTWIDRDPLANGTDPLLEFHPRAYRSKAGNSTVMIVHVTPFRRFVSWYMPFRKRPWELLNAAVFGPGHVAPDVEAFIRYWEKGRTPATVTYCRSLETGLYQVEGYDMPLDGTGR